MFQNLIFFTKKKLILCNLGYETVFFRYTHAYGGRQAYHDLPSMTWLRLLRYENGVFHFVGYETLHKGILNTNGDLRVI
jgi:hypothetical protein